MSPANYLTLANEAFTRPANPGIHPNIPAGATAAQIGEITRQHQADVKIWTECQNTDTALKNLLISSVDEQFIKSLHNRNTGYVTSSTWDILNFLYRNYGNITPAQLLENTAKLTEPYNPAEPIENLYTRFDDAMEFAAAANRPYTSEQILEYALLAILKTGQFKEACREWRRIQNPTWTQFKDHFATAHKEYRELEALAGPTGYSANNLIEEASTEIMQLINNVSTETKQIVHHELANVIQRLTQLETTVQQLVRTTSTTTDTKTPPDSATDKKAARETRLKKRFDNCDAYCWSHGFTGSSAHTSATCKAKLQGHQDSATKNNMMDGNKEKLQGYFKAAKFSAI
mmetsp:Transcript_6798/g.12794  ORF Transcript_6798/g.12794 Transcript_6798/m.12794 type:complete len:345 (-) Transcript_6798:984-2018(-)